MINAVKTKLRVCLKVSLQNVLHLYENTFDRKRISANPSPNPKAQ